MKAVCLFLLTVLLTCCSATRCSTDGPSGPIAPPPIPPHPDDGAALHESFLGDRSVIQFSPDAFGYCSALEVVYDGVNYGIILPTANLYLPGDKPGDKHEIQVTCLDDNGAPLNMQTVSQMHAP